SGVPRITLEVAPAARWVTEAYRVDEVVETGEGHLRLRMPVTATPWLERLLVRLGDEARVVDADEPAHRTAGRDAARRILARYEGGGGRVP
ncbi:MAG TPA: WYL domain-containing protein, partial [Acidimicrobiales bacterium]|nr:WYL domain-containing protein [Acidimicrobiales bacterium]